MTRKPVFAACSMSLAGVALGAALGATPAAADPSWSGIYLGASAGWVGSDVDWTYPNGTKPSAISSDELLVGGHIGIQHQFSQIVLGVEASLSYGVDDDFAGGSCPNAAFNCLGRTTSLFQVGPRVGWAPSSQWLIYATGGYANGRIQTSTPSVATGVAFDSTSSRHDGWYIGGGVEYALNRNWILGVEYQHVELDARDVTPVPFNATEVRNGLEAEMDIVRARITFKFGRDEPVERVEPLK